MAVETIETSARDPFKIHEDPEDMQQQEAPRGFVKQGDPQYGGQWDSEEDETEDEEEEEEEVDESVAEEMRKLEATFKGISDRFRLINRIGEGTFSQVYKAEDLQYHLHRNEWNKDGEYDDVRVISRKRRRLQDSQDVGNVVEVVRRPPYVAIKKIYVTSSPMRIQNELELLHDLRGCKFVCPLITAFRNMDQVVALLPHFPHEDFRIYYRHMTIPQMRHYFRALFSGLAAVHKHNILHRDVKPTNFLYNPETRHGVLVDFGLAEREGTDSTPCACRSAHQSNIYDPTASSNYRHPHGNPHGYPKNDPRPSRRANRAGTRGFRAPEVLLKCTSQTPKIDIWSCGVILLTLLAKRFPFFNSADDIDATIEMASIFGSRRMKQAAAMHGLVWDCNLATIGNSGYPLPDLILWSSCRGKKEPTPRGEPQAIRFLEGCLNVLPTERLSARHALQHEFLMNFDESDGDPPARPEQADDDEEEEDEEGETEGVGDGEGERESLEEDEMELL